MAQIVNFDPNKPFGIFEATLADPGAGNDYALQTVPAGEVWQVYSMRFRYSASAVVANRFMTYGEFNSASVEYVRLQISNAVTASAVPTISWSQLSPLSIAPSSWSQPLYGNFLFPGQKWQLFSVSKDVLDTFLDLRIKYKRWAL